MDAAEALRRYTQRYGAMVAVRGARASRDETAIVAEPEPEVLIPEAQALVDLMTAPDASHRSAINSFLSALVDAGVFDKIKGLWDLGAPSAQQDAYLNMVNPGVFTLVPSGGLTYTPSMGMNSNATTGYLDCGFAPNNAFFGQNDVAAHFYGYDVTGNQSRHILGVANSANFRLGLMTSGSSFQGRINSSTSATNATVPSHRYNALMSMVRRSSTQVEFWFDGALVGTAATTSSAPPSGNLTIFNSNGTMTHASTIVRLAFYTKGTLDAAEMAALNSAANTYVHATGPFFPVEVPAGQSNVARVYENPASGGSGDGTSNSNAGARLMIPASQGYFEAAFPGRPVVLTVLNSAVGGTTVLGDGSDPNQWWNYLTHEPLNVMLAWQALVEPLLLHNRPYHFVILWGQGEGATNDDVPPGIWDTATREALDYMRNILPDVPIIIQPLGRTQPYTAGIRRSLAEQKQMASEANFYLAPAMLDLQKQGEPAMTDYHFVNDFALSINPPNGYDRIAPYHARSFAAVLINRLNGVNPPAWRGPELVSAVKTASNKIVVTIAYPTGCDGTDFTPTSGIEGFRVVDAGGERTVSAAVRLSATTIELTTSTAIGSSRTIAWDPTATTLDRTKMIRDNAAFPMPMQWSGFINVG